MSDEAQAALREMVGWCWHHPKLRAQFTDEDFRLAWEHPQAAIERLKRLSVDGRLSREASVALDVLYEARAYAEATGTGFADTAPAFPGGAQAEMAALRAKDIAGTITKAEDRRLDTLYALRLGNDQRSTEAAQRPAQPSRKQALLRLSVDNRLTAEQSRELDAIYETALVPADDAGGEYQVDPDILASIKED